MGLVAKASTCPLARSFVPAADLLQPTPAGALPHCVAELRGIDKVSNAALIKFPNPASDWLR
jgi:hypothetical protein